MADRPGRYAGYRQAEQRNEVPSYRDWCIFQVWVGNPGSLQVRQGNHNGVRAGAYNRKPTPPSAITDLQRQ